MKKVKKAAPGKRSASKQKRHETEEVFYVGVREPSEVRRSLLEASRETVQFLQRYEKIREIRAQKHQAVQQLRIELRQLRTLLNTTKRVLPKTNIRAQLPKEPKPELVCTVCNNPFKTPHLLARHTKSHQKKEPKPKEEILEPPKEEPKPAHRPSELERLENELNDIEKKLEDLS